MTLPRYWTDPKSGSDYAYGERLPYGDMNAYRAAMFAYDAALERLLVANWTLAKTLTGGDILARNSCYEPISGNWVTAYYNGGTCTAMYGADLGSLATVSMGSGLTSINELACTPSGAVVANLVIAAGSLTGSAYKYRRSSNSGATWSSITSAKSDSTSIDTICWHNDKFVAGGSAGHVEYAGSPSWATFVEATKANSNDLWCLRSNGSLIIGVASVSTNKIVTSTNGVDWLERTLPVTIAGQPALCWSSGPQKWVIATAAHVLVSSDGITWTRTTPTGFTGVPNAMTSTGNILVATDGITPPYYLVISYDSGVTWRRVAAPTIAGGYCGLAVATDENSVVGQLALNSYQSLYSSLRIV